MGAGARAGTLLNTQQDETIRGWAGNISHKYVGRHAFLRELLSNVPEERMHADMRLERLIEGGEEGTTLIFADGSRQVFDVVVGADGINSRVRQHILADHPSRDPAYDGWWNALSLIPSELVVPIVGADVLNTEKPAQTMYAGEKGEGLLVSFVHGMEAVNVILVMRGGMQFTPEKYPMEVSKEDVLKTFERWPKNLGVDLVEVSLATITLLMNWWLTRTTARGQSHGRPDGLLAAASAQACPYLRQGQHRLDGRCSSQFVFAVPDNIFTAHKSLQRRVPGKDQAAPWPSRTRSCCPRCWARPRAQRRSRLRYVHTTRSEERARR